MDFKMYISLFFSVVLTIVFLIVIFYGSRWLKKRYTVNGGGGQRHIKIIDRAVLGQDKSIAIAEVLGSKYLIGISSHQITLLKDLGEIEIPDSKPEGQADFAAVFGEALKKQITDVKDRFINRGGKL